MGVSATLRRHVDKEKLISNASTLAQREALARGVQIAKDLVRVRFGHLRESIQILNQYAYGVSGSKLASSSQVSYGKARDYSGYQEGIWPTNTAFTPYLEPSADQVADEFVGIYRKAIKGARYK